MAIVLNEEKKKRMEDLVKSLKEIDSAIFPYQEQRKDLRKSYTENEWLDTDEFDTVKRAYNALKRKIDIDDVATVMDVVKGIMGAE